MKLFTSPSHFTRILFANIVTSVICSTAAAAVTAVEPNLTDRCGSRVGGASVARVGAVLLEEKLDPTRMVIEISRRMLLNTTKVEEIWRVALRVRTDDGHLLERTEVLRFDDKCEALASAITPQF